MVFLLYLIFASSVNADKAGEYETRGRRHLFDFGDGSLDGIRWKGETSMDTEGRRNLLGEAFNLAYGACFSSVYPPQCADVTSTFSIQEHMSLLPSNDVNAIEEWSAGLIGYYCCILRSGEKQDLLHAAFEFPEMCGNTDLQVAFKFVTSEVESTANLWTNLVMDYCPNNDVPTTARRPSHFMELYRLSLETKLQTGKETEDQAIHECSSEQQSDGDEFVDFTVLLPEDDPSDWHHVIAFWGDELNEETYIDWMPNIGASSWFTLATQSEYSLLSRRDGYFRTPVKMDLSRGVRVSGLNKKDMLAAKASIESEGRYDIMFNNCAHQIARIAKAGLGCEIREIPFLLPAALYTVGAEIGQELTQDELDVIQAQLNEVGADETFVIQASRLMRRALATARAWFH